MRDGMDDLQPFRFQKNISQLLRSINDPNDLLSRTGYTILAVIIGVFSVAGIFLLSVCFSGCGDNKSPTATTTP